MAAPSNPGVMDTGIVPGPKQFLGARPIHAWPPEKNMGLPEAIPTVHLGLKM